MSFDRLDYFYFKEQFSIYASTDIRANVGDTRGFAPNPH